MDWEYEFKEDTHKHTMVQFLCKKHRRAKKLQKDLNIKKVIHRFSGRGWRVYDGCGIH